MYQPLLSTPARSTLKSNTTGMEILVLGLCRTGTNAMKIALEELGYDSGSGVFHMFTLFQDLSNVGTWNRALDAKYKGIGSPLSKEEWDGLLGSYRAGTDLLFAMFVDELVAAYPDAKIVLTTRSADSWHRSMMNTIYPARHHGFVYTAYHRLFKTRYGVTIKIFDVFWEYFFYNDFPKYGKQVFNAHNNYVRAIAHPDRFLEFKPGDGWGPLCEFLKKDLPKKPWPKINDTTTFQKNFSQKQKRLLSVASDASLVLLFLLVLVGWNWTSLKGIFDC